MMPSAEGGDAQFQAAHHCHALRRGCDLRAMTTVSNGAVSARGLKLPTEMAQAVRRVALHAHEATVPPLPPPSLPQPPRLAAAPPTQHLMSHAAAHHSGGTVAAAQPSTQAPLRPRSTQPPPTPPRPRCAQPPSIPPPSHPQPHGWRLRSPPNVRHRPPPLHIMAEAAAAQPSAPKFPTPPRLSSLLLSTPRYSSVLGTPGPASAGKALLFL